MKVHISMVSGKHFKVDNKQQCASFMEQFNSNSTAPVLITVDGWDMILVKQHIECVSVLG